MRKPTTAATAALILALTLAGCANDDTDSPAAATDEASASVMAKDDTMAKDDAMEKDEAMAEDDGKDDAMDKDGAMAKEGAWIDQAAYDADPASYHAAGDVVLFFNASWCPTCQAAVKSLDAEGTPAGLTVVSVDYDSANDLRKEYGVTVQHTFVQVDEAGTELTKFTGSTSGAEIAASTV